MRVKKLLQTGTAFLLIFLSVFTNSVAETDEVSSFDSATDNKMLLLGSNRYEHMPSDAVVNNRFSTEGFEKVMESDILEVYLRSTVGGIRILDKRSGYIWGSLASDKPENMNTTWAAIGNSAVQICYFTEAGVEKKIGADGRAITFTKRENRLDGHVDFSSIGISFDVRIALDGAALSVGLVEGSIKESKDFLLGEIIFLPFLGSAAGDELEGYALLPDGSGGLMKFKRPAKYLTGFSKRIYGDDYAVDSLLSVNDLKSNRTNDFAVREQTVSMPLFGIVHGVKQNAFFAHIESSEEYARLCADPAGIITDYNTAYASFIYRQKYEQPISRKGAGVQILQKVPNALNAKISYLFLTGRDADYVGMAKEYQNILIKEDILKKRQTVPDNIPLAVDFLMADVKKGFLGDGTQNITSVEYVEHALKQLSKTVSGPLMVELSGWQEKGLGGYKKEKVQTKGMFGKFENLANIVDFLKEQGGGLSLQMKPFTAKKGQFDIRRTGAVTLSQVPVVLKRDDASVFLGDTYFLKMSEAADMLKKQAERFEKDRLENLTVLDTDLLYGEYLSGKTVSRTEMKMLLTKQIEELSKNADITLERPNAYLFGAASRYKNTPMTNSQYLFESDTVPFLQIVLSGFAELYAPYANQSFYAKEDILKHMDFNTYPAFLMTEKSNSTLRDTASAELYSTCFDDWEQTINVIYNEVNDVIKHVSGQKILERQVLYEGVNCTQYESGEVIVNYTKTEYIYKGIQVKDQSALYLPA